MEGCRCSKNVLRMIGRSPSLSHFLENSGRQLLADTMILMGRVMQPQASRLSTVANVVTFGRCQSTLKIQRTFVRGQRTKVQPSISSVLKDAEQSKVIDPDVTLYHRSRQHSININLEQQHSKALVKSSSSDPHLHSVGTGTYESPENLKDALRAVRREQMSRAGLNDKDSTAISSIDEMMYQEIKPNLELSRLPGIYARLAKLRLTGLVVVTTIAGYAMAPGPFEGGTFLLCCLGTAMTSSAANAINQFLEVPYDAQMNRTKTRPIVKGQISPLHAVSFAIVSSAVGATILCVGVNPLTAALGVFNLAMYTMVYTPMKRLSIANTWVGSIVGAVPPLMGWAASAGTLHSGSWLLGAVLFAWQFPHFCALSWNLQSDYSRAGYRMMSVIAPDLCKRTSLRYSVVLSGLCLSAPYFDLTTWTFAADSLPLNAYLVYLAWNFYRDGDSKSSRKLFHFTLIHLPALLLLMLISKKHFGKQEASVAKKPELEVT